MLNVRPTTSEPLRFRWLQVKNQSWHITAFFITGFVMVTLFYVYKEKLFAFYGKSGGGGMVKVTVAYEINNLVPSSTTGG